MKGEKHPAKSSSYSGYNAPSMVYGRESIHQQSTDIAGKRDESWRMGQWKN
jgi:hypothetical protein